MRDKQHGAMQLSKVLRTIFMDRCDMIEQHKTHSRGKAIKKADNFRPKSSLRFVDRGERRKGSPILKRKDLQ